MECYFLLFHEQVNRSNDVIFIFSFHFFIIFIDFLNIFFRIFINVGNKSLNMPWSDLLNFFKGNYYEFYN
jgi:hypothetical protein